MIRRAAATAAVGLMTLSALPASAAGESGEAIFKARCSACHEPAVGGALTRPQLAQKTRAEIVQALTAGPMKPMAQQLTASQIQAVSVFLSPNDGRPPKAAKKASHGDRPSRR